MTEAQEEQQNIGLEHDTDSGEWMQFLTFAVDKEEYGVDLLQIREIKGWTEATRLPNSPDFVRGVINLRGAVIPVVDLKSRFSMGVTQATEKHVVMIIAVGKRLIGVLVDSVSDIVEVESEQIKPAPQMENKIDGKYVSGLVSLKEKMVVILDIEALFESAAMKKPEEVL